MSSDRPTSRRARLLRVAKDRLPAPMAAPETPALRRLRLSLVRLLIALAGLTLALAPLQAIVGLWATLLWLGMALTILAIAILWLRAKWRADEAWLDRDQGE
jgi:type VI protein secretion system component VasK